LASLCASAPLREPSFICHLPFSFSLFPFSFYPEVPMSTPAQLAANQRNAKLSTGPRTPEGKERSAQNALKHGLTSTAPILPSDDPAPFHEFQQDMLQDLNPQSTNQATLAQQI